MMTRANVGSIPAEEGNPGALIAGTVLASMGQEFQGDGSSQHPSFGKSVLRVLRKRSTARVGRRSRWSRNSQWLGFSAVLFIVALTGAACSGGTNDPAPANASASPGTPSLTPPPSVSTAPEATPTPPSTPELDDDLQPGVLQFAWETDFSKHTVNLSEIAWGGVPPRGIPAITEPRFVSIDEAAGQIGGGEAPVIVVEIDGEARGYPPAILLHHEIVNDVLGGVPIAVTYCPLCNSAVVFERTVGDEVLEFHVTGNLRFSDLVMFDTSTESWWQQITGEAIVGSYAGTVLKVVPSQVISLDGFRAVHPEGTVLSPDGESVANPYFRYDDPASVPFLFGGDVDPRLPAMMRVATVESGGVAVAVPFDLLAAERVVRATIGSEDVVILYAPGLRSVLDATLVEDGRDVGQVGVFRAAINGKNLALQPGPDGRFLGTDGTAWSIAGVALDGPQAGARLEPVPHGEHFWFAWAAFFPNTRIAG